MGWINLDPLTGVGIDPTGQDTATGKNKSVRLAAVNDGQFQIAIKRRHRYGFPHAAISGDPDNLALS